MLDACPNGHGYTSGNNLSVRFSSRSISSEQMRLQTCIFRTFFIANFTRIVSYTYIVWYWLNLVNSHHRQSPVAQWWKIGKARYWICHVCFFSQLIPFVFHVCIFPTRQNDTQSHAFNDIIFWWSLIGAHFAHSDTRFTNDPFSEFLLHFFFASLFGDSQNYFLSWCWKLETWWTDRNNIIHI